MKIAAVSDLHGYLPDIPECDLLLLAGDICPDQGQASWLNREFRNWLGAIPAKEVVLVWGNHDLLAEHKPELIPNDLRCHILTDRQIELNGLKIYGSPWQKRFYDWAFNLDEEDLAKKWDLIPDDTDILVLHGPPYEIGDLAWHKIMNPAGCHAGSPSLLERIKSIKPKLSVFGHIHSGRGLYDIDGCVAANVTLVDEHYQSVYPPMLFEFKDALQVLQS